MVRGQRQANRSLKHIRRDAKQVGDAFRGMAAAAGLFSGAALFRDLIRAQVQMQQITYTMQAATGSAQQAAQAFEFVRKESA
ncbi:MAG TPA: hypothetical protein VFL78_11745 [Rhodanobacteraceae bacterium]|nr:hypothetical protein [Rhodanobacteraceae bacterium]